MEPVEQAAPAVVWTPRLGQHVEAARQRAGLTRGELAERLGVTEESVRRWERGWTAPAPDRLARLLVVLAIDQAAVAGPTQPGGGAGAGSSPGDDLPALACRLRDERRARGISQAAAAEALGVAQATYAGWETGRSQPDRRFLPRVGRFLGLGPLEVARLAAAPARRPGPAEVRSALGELMAQRRADLGLTREALAAAVGVSARTVGAWERGDKTPRSTRLRRLAGALGVPVAEVAARAASDAGVPAARAHTPIGELIERERLARGLTRDALAAEASVAPTTLTRWARGHHRPAPATLRRIAEALDLDADAVLAAAGRTRRRA